MSVSESFSQKLSKLSVHVWSKAKKKELFFMFSFFLFKIFIDHHLLLFKCLLSYLCSIFVFLIFHPSVLFAWPPSSSSACVHAWNVMGRIGTTELSLKQAPVCLEYDNEQFLCFISLVDIHARLTTHYTNSPSGSTFPVTNILAPTFQLQRWMRVQQQKRQCLK